MNGRKFVPTLQLGLVLVLLASLCFSSPALAATDIDVIIHGVSVSPVQGRLAYQVTSYVSVTETNGAPIRDLKDNNFALFQDSQQVTYKLEEASGDPVSIVLVMDTSGSMSGAPLEAAKLAGQTFIEGLGASDQVAIVSFNKDIKTVSDFTANHGTSTGSIKTLITAPNSGTCLYDAAYKAVEMANALPPGRRGVVLLTDGRDELADQSGPCSSYKLDDVLSLASKSVSRVPIYTVGLGETIDKTQLERMANLSGGLFLETPKADQLLKTFQTLADQLRYQYKLSYVSESTPGTHLLLVKVNVSSMTDQDSQEFALPDVPVVLTFSKPATGDKASGKLHVELDLKGQVDQIASVQYSINTRKYDPIKQAPFSADLDLADLPAGDLVLTAQALDKDGKELAAQSVKFSMVLPTSAAQSAAIGKTAVATTAALTSAATAPAAQTFDLSKNLPVIIAAIVVLVLVIVLTIILVLRQKKQKLTDHLPDENGGMSDATMDGGFEHPEVLAVLTVLQSDDPSRIGEMIKIYGKRTTMGRSDKNDLVFAKDKAASRQHAMMEYDGEKFVVSEVALPGDDGTRKWPTYGTYVNESRISEGGSAILSTGAELRLGNRLKLRFDPVIASKEEKTEMTYDGLNMSDDSTSTIEV